MPRIHQILVTLVLLGLAACPVAAQDADNELPESEPVFRVLGFGDSYFQGLKYEAPNREVVELEFRPNRRSVAYAVPKDPSLITFFTEEEDPRRRDRARRVTQAVARIQSSMQEVLLVFLFEGEQRDRLSYKVEVLDESPETFDAGVYRFLNLTGVEMKARLGESIFDLRDGLSEPIRIPVQQDNPIPFQIAVSLSTGWRIVHSTHTLPDAQYGSLYVLKPPLQQDSLDLRVERLW